MLSTVPELLIARGRRREMWSRCPAFDWDQSLAIKKTRTESYSCSTKALERISFFLLNYRWLEKSRCKWDLRIAARFKFKRQSCCQGRDTSWRREEPANTKKSGHCSRPLNMDYVKRRRVGITPPAALPAWSCTAVTRQSSVRLNTRFTGWPTLLGSMHAHERRVTFYCSI